MLLPQPLPPMMMKTSPRLTREVEVAHEHEAAEGHGEVAHGDVRAFGAGRSQLPCRVAILRSPGCRNHGEEAAGDDDADDAGDHRRGRGVADRRGAAAALHAAQAAGERDQHAVHRRLEHAADEIGERARHATVCVEIRATRRDRACRRRSTAPPRMPTKSAYRQSSGIIRHSASMRGRTRNSIGEMPTVVKRVDLLRHLHGAELGGEGRAGAAGHDDAGHHRAHLAHHGDADQIGDVDRGAELLELHGADEGEDHADQEADQRDDAAAPRRRTAGSRRSRSEAR